MLLRYLKSSLAEVSADETDEAGELREVARALYKDMVAMLFLKTRMYTHPPVVFETSNYLAEEYTINEQAVRRFANFIKHQEGVPVVLSPSQ